MREKKFSKSRVLALVLAFAMVVTAVPFAGFDAKAADDNNSVTVYRAYNTQTNDHLFTADENEYKTTIQNPIWNDEGRAWSAPKSSSTPIYRAYNTSSGEHLYTADAGEYNSLPGGWNKEGTLLYSDDAMGKPVYRLFCAEWDLHLYTADENEMATLLASGSWTADFGGEAAYYALADQSAEVSIIDMEGLQEDGTATTNDTLQVVFGSSLGVPASVAWYKDGAVVKVADTNLKEEDFKLGRNADGQGGSTPLTKGEYYASIVNKDGKTFTTNSITVGESVNATMTIADIDDMYDDTTPDIVYSEKDTRAIIDLNFNKYYNNGTLYIVPTNEEDIADYGVNVLGSAFNPGGVATSYFDPKTDCLPVAKASDLTNKRANAAATGGFLGIYYEDEKTGEIYTKIVVGQPLETAGGNVVNFDTDMNVSQAYLHRGTTYMAVLDQTSEQNFIKDLKDGDPLALLKYTLSNAEEAPYVVAPADVQLSSSTYASTANTAWSLTFVDEDDDALEWMTTANTAGAFQMPVFYGSDDPAVGSDTQVTAGTFGALDKGKADITTTTGIGKLYAYATIKTVKGVFDEDELVYVSEIIGAKDSPAKNMVMSMSTSGGDVAKVTFDQRKNAAQGTVYILQGTKSGWNAGDIDWKNLAKNKVVGMATLSQGQQEVEIKDVFEESQLDSNTGKDTFLAVFVPDDTASWSPMVAADTLNPAAPAIDGVDKAATGGTMKLTEVTAMYAFTQSKATEPIYCQVVNQFLTAKNLTEATTGAVNGLTLTASNGHTCSFVAVVADSKVTVTPGTAVAGDILTAYIPSTDQYVSVQAKTEGGGLVFKLQ